MFVPVRIFGRAFDGHHKEKRMELYFWNVVFHDCDHGHEMLPPGERQQPHSDQRDTVSVAQALVKHFINVVKFDTDFL